MRSRLVCDIHVLRIVANTVRFSLWQAHGVRVVAAMCQCAAHFVEQSVLIVATGLIPPPLLKEPSRTNSEPAQLLILVGESTLATGSGQASRSGVDATSQGKATLTTMVSFSLQ